MPDEEKTDWTGIAARLRENENRHACMCEFVDAWMDQRKPWDNKAIELLSEYNKARNGYSQTILALAEAERMVEKQYG